MPNYSGSLPIKAAEQISDIREMFRKSKHCCLAFARGEQQPGTPHLYAHIPIFRNLNKPVAPPKRPRETNRRACLPEHLGQPQEMF